MFDFGWMHGAELIFGSRALSVCEARNRALLVCCSLELLNSTATTRLQ
jgi:hypothetical protein